MNATPLHAVPFVKASACGNDFLIVDGAHAPSDIVAFTRRICDRHQGVGADGVEWLFPAPDADIYARLLNADGSEAELSGNGTRCVAAYLASQHHKASITVRTGAGVKTCTLINGAGPRFEFEIDMGVPQLGDEFALTLPSGEMRGIPVSMGNPHFVVFVSGFSPGWQAEAAEIGHHSYFKKGVNVELVSVINTSDIDVRFLERGVGETRSSGTGSCASAAASIARGRVRSPVRVHTPGGLQSVRWEDHMFLTGSAQLVCRGDFFI